MSLIRLPLIAILMLLSSIVAPAEEPVSVSVCSVESDPASYNHKLIEVTGFLSHGFENFTLFDPECPTGSGIWLEYGGTVSSGTIYCCGVTPARSRPKQLVVENIPIPLVTDEQFRILDRLLSRELDTVVRATIVGRFFSGEKVDRATGSYWGGYGHFGCCSLLAIQNVLSVDPQDRDDLDYRASADHPDVSKVGCGFGDRLPRRGRFANLIRLQGEADSGERAWTFEDPTSVASEAIAKVTGVEQQTITGVRQVRKAKGRRVYTWQSSQQHSTYLITVSRPYWLSVYARGPERVAWVAIAVFELDCPDE